MKRLIFLLVTPIVLAINNIYGDSILAPGSPIIHDISKIYNTSFNNYAIIGSAMQSGWVKSIPQQYIQHQFPVPTNVIMNGGGNDVYSMTHDCMEFNDVCRINIDHVSTLASHMISEMRKDGVQNIIYVGFYNNSTLNTAIHYGSNKLLEVCKPKYHCYFVDLRYLYVPTTIDNIHPNLQGYNVILKAIQQTIQKYNISL